MPRWRPDVMWSSRGWIVLCVLGRWGCGRGTGGMSMRRGGAGGCSCRGSAAGAAGSVIAVLPAFVLAWRLDTAETVGAVIAEVAGGSCGARPAAKRAGVPHTTARGWLHRFRRRAVEAGVAFAALAVELGGEAIWSAADAASAAPAHPDRPPRPPARHRAGPDPGRRAGQPRTRRLGPAHPALARRMGHQHGADHRLVDHPHPGQNSKPAATALTGPPLDGSVRWFAWCPGAGGG